MKGEPGPSRAELSRELGIDRRTLGRYERAGLVRPRRGADGGSRFGPGERDRLRAIVVLSRDLGVNLAGIDIVLRLRERVGELQAELETVRAALGEHLRARREEARSHSLVPLRPAPVLRQRPGGR